jgi:hypothetical protein
MPAIDLYPGAAGRSIGYDAPANDAAPVTPSDVTDLAYVSRAILISVAGNIKVDTRGTDKYPGQTGVVIAVPAGVIPLRVSRIYATSTTATGITAIW